MHEPHVNFVVITQVTGLAFRYCQLGYGEPVLAGDAQRLVDAAPIRSLDSRRRRLVSLVVNPACY